MEIELERDRAGDEELLFGKGLDGQSNCKRKKNDFQDYRCTNKRKFVCLIK